MSFPLCLQTFTIGDDDVELFVPDAEAVRRAYETGQISFPYWSRVWPAALALSEFILQHRHRVQNKAVLELGAGLGLPSLVAARFAKRVLCTDGAAEAIQIVARSAAHLCLQNIETAVADWNSLAVDAAIDVLLLSDVAYDPGGFASLVKVVNDYLHTGTTVIVSVPQRLQSKAFVLPLLHKCVQHKEYTTADHDVSVVISVLVLQNEEA